MIVHCIIYGEGGFDPDVPDHNIVEEVWRDTETGETYDHDPGGA